MTSGPFRLGDVRGLYPDELDEAFARRFAHAFSAHFRPRGKIATGRDMRDSSISLQQSLNSGFREAGYDVVDLGLCMTELGYFASSQPGVAATVMVTASHNPLRYNGFKCCLSGGKPVTFDTGLADVKRLMSSLETEARNEPGDLSAADLSENYITFLESSLPLELASGRVALNGLNGTAATIAAPLCDRLRLPVTWFRREPGPIPSEGADPANPRLGAEMKQMMASGNFDFGVAWDADGDRCVFFDEDGDLVPTYYVIGLLADAYLTEAPGASIVFDTKLCWNTLEIIETRRGVAVPSETGHAFMKQKMRAHNAVYGGELSSHHYFADFFHCDSGMFAWLKVLQITARHRRTIAELLEERRRRFCSTPEITLKLNDVQRAFDEILDTYGPAARIDYFDGLSFEITDGWRFSLRRSKTEPVVRLNMESRAGPNVLLEGGRHLLRQLRPFQQDSGDLSEYLYIQ